MRRAYYDNGLYLDLCELLCERYGDCPYTLVSSNAEDKQEVFMRHNNAVMQNISVRTYGEPKSHDLRQ